MRDWRHAVHVINVIQFVAVVTGTLTNSEVRLREKVIVTEAGHARPVKNISGPVSVIIGLEIAQLIDVSTAAQTLVMTGYLRKTWHNELISWKKEDYDGLASINVDEQETWTPEILIYTSVNTNSGTGKSWSSHDIKTKVTISYDGTTTWLTPISFKSSCVFGVVDFPYDAQKCIIEIGPWSEDSSKVICTASDLPMTTSEYIPSGEWDIVSATPETALVKYGCCIHPYSLLKVHLHLKRKPLYYQFNLVLPCVFLVVCMLAGHWLPPQSGERIALGITIALTYVVMLHVSSASVPRSSDTSTISKIYTILIAEVCLSIFGSMYVLLLFNRSASCMTWIPRFLERMYVPKSLWKITLIKEGIYKEDNDKSEDEPEEIQLSSVNVIMTNFHAGKNGNKEEPEGTVRRRVAREENDDEAKKELLKELKFLNDGEYDGVQQNRMVVRSIYAAELLDRILFWVFLIGSILTFVIIAAVHY